MERSTRTRKYVSAVVLGAAFALTVVADGSAGQVRLVPDSSFGSGGIVKQEIGLVNAPKVALDRGGRILMSDGLHVTRYLRDGSLDPSFGDGGLSRSIGLPGTSSGEVGDIEPLANGDILTALSSYSRVNNITGLEVHRLRSSGLPDMNFGRNGIFGYPAAGRHRLSATSTAVRPDGRIYVTGGRKLGTRGSKATLLLLDRDGTVDPSYRRTFLRAPRPRASNGDLLVNELTDVVALPNGGALVAGVNGRRITIFKLDAKGHLARGFAGGGSLNVRFAGICCYASLNGTADYPSPKVVTDRPRKRQYVLFRGDGGRNQILAFHRNGTRIRSFGKRGLMAVPGKPYSFFATSLVVRPGGILLLSGFTQKDRPSSRTATFAQVDQRGRMVRTFGLAGFQRTVPGGIGRITSSVLDRQGRLVIAGDDFLGDSLQNVNFVTARFGFLN